MPLPITFGAASARGFGLFSAPVALLDEYFEYVTLLLPGNGTNGAQNNTFLDSSTNNFTITRNGNTTQGTFSPYGSNWSNYFDGSGDFLSTSISPATLSGDFTVEGWIYLDNLSLDRPFVCLGDTFHATGVVFYVTTGGRLAVYGNNVVILRGTTQSVPTNSWVHVAFVRSSGTIKVYLNGTADSTTVSNATSFAVNCRVGAELYNGGLSVVIQGYISSCRIVAGTAVYTSNFTPPTAPLTAITNTSLLTCQSNRFIDNSANAFAITVNGNTSVQRFSPFSPTAAYSAATIGGSGYFDGSGDYLTVPSNAALDFGTGDFTIEAWVYRTSSSGGSTIATNSSTGDNNYFQLDYESNGVGSFEIRTSGGTTVIFGTINGGLNTWVHIAVSRQSGTVRLFINGALDKTVTITSACTQRSVLIGGFLYPGFDEYFTGYISNLRIVKGTAVYTSAFTPPTSPLTAVANTSLLLNYTNAGIIDNAMMNDLETVGNAQISTSVSKFGGGSMAFDGTGDRLFTRYNPNLELGSGDFTVEAWVYFSTLPSNAAAAIVSYGDSDNTPRWLLYYDSRTGSANGLRFSVINGSGSAIILVEGGGTSGWAANTWYHVAVTRSGSSWKLFRDGTQTGSTLTDSDSIPTASNNGLVVGAEPNGGIPLTGYIDDLRITKGVARYTANFTPPTQAFLTR